jgi:hypothetical protein
LVSPVEAIRSLWSRRDAAGRFYHARFYQSLLALLCYQPLTLYSLLTYGRR